MHRRSQVSVADTADPPCVVALLACIVVKVQWHPAQLLCFKCQILRRCDFWLQVCCLLPAGTLLTVTAAFSLTHLHLTTPAPAAAAFAGLPHVASLSHRPTHSDLLLPADADSHFVICQGVPIPREGSGRHWHPIPHQGHCRGEGRDVLQRCYNVLQHVMANARM